MRFATVAEMFQHTAAAAGDRVAIRTRDDAVRWTWAEYARRARAAAGGLAALGVGRGDTVALMLTNRPEFHVADAAALHLGAVPWSIYVTYPADQIAHLLRDAGARVAITERAFEDTLRRAAADAGVEHVVVVDDGEGLDALGGEGSDVEAAWQAIAPEDLVTIIYTSGTTGPPKGVQLTHRNVVATIEAYTQVWSLPPAPRILSWLPMAHVAERLVSHYAPMLLGATVTTCPDPREVAAALVDVRPNYFFAVPRIWEKLKAGVEARGVPGLEASLDAARRARAAGEAYDDEVLAAVRAAIGLDEAAMTAVGAAPCPFEVIEFFNLLGIPLGEVYGQSEGTAAATQNPPDAIKVGTVGPPLPGVEVRVAEDGEVLVRGPGVMAGYRGDPEATAEAIDADGWLHSGDIGELDDDGYLRIVDRKKELIISSAGKNMSPANIEAALKTASPLIDQAVAIGDRRPYNVALLVLDPEAADAWAREHGEAAVEEEVARGVARANERLARVEQIKRWHVVREVWEPGGVELTPTMKLKRKPIAERYAEQIDALYAEAAAVSGR